MLKIHSPFVLMLGLMGLSGCGDSGPRLVDVEGIVLLDGKPLDKVRVEFWPLDEGPQSAALTDDKGRFVLATLTEQKGAVVGKHKVVLKDVSIFEGAEFMGRAGADVDMAKGRKPRISSKYTNATQTPLETEIANETRDLKFEVEPYKR